MSVFTVKVNAEHLFSFFTYLLECISDVSWLDFSSRTENISQSQYQLLAKSLYSDLHVEIRKA